MRVARERLIFLALCALDEIVDQAEGGPVRPTIGLRFALAFLWACSDGTARGCYDGFWRCVTPKKPDEQYRSHSLYHQFAGDHLRGITKTLGFDFETKLRARINRARGMPPEHRSLIAERVKRGAADDEEQKARARRARFCDLERGGRWEGRDARW
jgi:hypothetical protein